MPKIRPIQSSFEAGEISPLLYSRMDDDIYEKGVEKLVNFECDGHGPIERRNGTRNIWWDKEGVAGEYGRLFDFNTAQDEAYAVLVTTTKINVFSGSGIMNLGNIIDNPDFDSPGAGDGWDIHLATDPLNSILFTSGYLYMKSVRQPLDSDEIVWIQKQFSVTDSTQEQIFKMKIKDQVTLGSDFFITVEINDQEDFSGTNIAKEMYGANSLGQHVSFAFTPNTGNFWLRISLQCFLFSWNTDDTGSVWIDRVEISDHIFSNEISFPSPFVDEEVIKSLQMAMPPDLDIMVFVTEHLQPQMLSYDNLVWHFGEFPFLHAMTGQEDFIGDNAPTSIAFFQGRMWLGGPKYLRQFSQGVNVLQNGRSTIYASRSNDYYDFDVGNDPDDPMQFTISTRGNIKWMLGGDDLHVGTSFNEVTIYSDGPVLIPSDAHARMHSAYGSSSISARNVAKGIMFIDSNKRRVYYSVYSDERQGYTPVDIAFPSEHITKMLIIETEIAQTPTISMFFPTEGGELIGLTFEPNRNIAGWYRTKTNGKIISMTVTEQKGGTQIFWLVKRMIGGNDRLSIETVDADLYMDNSSSHIHDIAEDYCDHLEHLEGQVVQVLVDGAVQTDKTVVNGRISISPPGKEIKVGLRYESEMLTLPLENRAIKKGSEPYASMKKRYNRIYVRVVTSALPIINGENPRERIPVTPMNTAEPIETTDVKVTNLGWDKYARIKIQQDLPYPCIITSIYGELGIEGL